MKKLSDKQSKYAAGLGFSEADLLDYWRKIFDFRINRLKTDEDHAAEDADEVIEALLTEPEEDEESCSDLIIGSLISYYGTQEYHHLFTAEEKQSIEDHLAVCVLCTANLMDSEDFAKNSKYSMHIN